MAREGLRGHGELPLEGGINVVSLVDVAFVLLIIFMITAPIMQGGVDVQLPRAEARPLQPREGLVVSVDRQGSIFVDETAQRQVLVDAVNEVVVNGKTLDEHFGNAVDLNDVLLPFRVTGTEGRYNAMIKVEGGGVTGQAGAVRHGIARALLELDPEAHRLQLRQAGLLTRDPRMKERKKYGLKRARKAPQYTKR